MNPPIRYGLVVLLLSLVPLLGVQTTDASQLMDDAVLILSFDEIGMVMEGDAPSR